MPRTTGTIGPNLDDAFASDKEQGFSLQTIAEVVRGQIAYPEPPMPGNLVDGRHADDVAGYVAECSANPTCGVTAANPLRRRRPTTTPTTATTAPPAGRSRRRPARRSSRRPAAATATR